LEANDIKGVIVTPAVMQAGNLMGNWFRGSPFALSCGRALPSGGRNPDPFFLKPNNSVSHMAKF